ncbi:MAG: hypothetical protein Q8M16_08990 [Pirellulaceae bacterium]|nr:hypothetical protein [Pirellulaceae bacterium]
MNEWRAIAACHDLVASAVELDVVAAKPSQPAIVAVPLKVVAVAAVVAEVAAIFLEATVSRVAVCVDIVGLAAACGCLTFPKRQDAGRALTGCRMIVAAA